MLAIARVSACARVSVRVIETAQGLGRTRLPGRRSTAGHVDQGDLLTFAFVGRVVGPKAARPSPPPGGSESGSVSLPLLAKVHGLNVTLCPAAGRGPRWSRPDTSTSWHRGPRRAPVDAASCRPSPLVLDVRRPRLPRIRPETLEAPDFAEIGAKTKPPHRTDAEALRAVGVVAYLSRQRNALVRGHARQRAHSGIEGGHWSTCPG